ncbi:protein NETWORKED 4B-like [Chenopodium quinoa]|uniref:NAB domain-containing protein n=1 Tax=Chenopodium quinoa TaxID=63459 RepID=A0A803MSS5_CHEQI|nr:protein NETWORKED 4B-like [Chenopodium quinoa]XP_021730912.1 protein NETWORKED 4B-like [Chenopodium quinoa]
METKKQSSHCWWFDSYNSAKCSPWLESTVTELNEKTDSMMKLIEQDADSFAQRAEMYYKKRPELISMVEDFYRAHRSLAERYDLLKSDRGARVRSPLRSSLSLPKEEYEYVLDSATNSVKSFDSFAEATYSSEEFAESEIDDPDHEDEVVQIDQETAKPFSGGASYDELMKLRDELDRLREENENQNNIIKQKDGEKEELVKQLSDNISKLREMRDEMAAVKEDNLFVVMKQTSEVLVPFDEVTKLKDEMESLKVENMKQKELVKKKADEVIEVTKKFEEAKFELMKFEEEAETKNRYLKDALVLKEEENIEVARQFEEAKSELAKLREDIKKENGQTKNEEKQEAIRHLKDALVEKDEEKHEAIRKLKDALIEKDLEKRDAIRQLTDALVEKDTEKKEAIRQLKDALAEKDEQKREAIRQLSVAMEILREESKMLKKSIVDISPKKKNADYQIFKGVNLGKLFNLSSSSQPLK